MASHLAFDHAVILVNDLDKASTDYRVLGFNVFYGGKHADGKTHNALIVFRDGTYIELLAPTALATVAKVDPNDHNSFLFMFLKGEGFGGYALLSLNLQTDVEGMQRRSLNVHLRPLGGRVRPDGKELRWRSAMLEGTMTPFFIQDDTPRKLRVPDDIDKTQHRNGVTGIAGIMTAVRDLKSGVERYRAILEDGPQQQDVMTADFALGQFTITLVAPTGDDADLGDYLTKRGEVPYKLWLWTDQADKAGALDTTLTHGTPIELMG